ncbi:MAG: molecular chaperone TorD family protein [Candidatus Competibacteraceae bacterium]|nr:molecular chaperone TorD family protein [Candidatus Competibacteraceae bacterium]MCB1805235.1 molecular chaperone TorD family protein [Candidatus Competibacteraceae bacterium]MCB1814242.1 molecular chaperone TorD family protein [Candidatus Competibacteraceae bacterium]
MANPIHRAMARSHVWQLLAMTFSHPVPELHAQLADGRFQAALDQSLTAAYGFVSELPYAQTPFTVFEAQYIELFDTGQKGRPAVPLCAGEYIDLLDGQPRPTLMLQYVQFYRHFGLKPRTQGEDKELPDHLSCQLECLAWLAHLEAQSWRAEKPVHGYQQAQYDFIDKLLARFSNLFSQLLARESKKRACDPLFAALAQVLHEFQQRNLIEFDSMLATATPVSVPAEPVAAAATQDLWG